MGHRIHNVLVSIQVLLKRDLAVHLAGGVVDADDLAMRKLQVLEALAEVNAVAARPTRGLRHQRPLVPLLGPSQQLLQIARLELLRCGHAVPPQGLLHLSLVLPCLQQLQGVCRWHRQRIGDAVSKLDSGLGAAKDTRDAVGQRLQGLHQLGDPGEVLELQHLHPEPAVRHVRPQKLLAQLGRGAHANDGDAPLLELDEQILA
mmetsp:Transcript_54134/g.136767  ORF Transcript_54134/g.136767 Transcript_54134/m.136767 type:complete len:203 (-) Transcript_54134:302-910(-)